jgi:hypothetical protein
MPGIAKSLRRPEHDLIQRHAVFAYLDRIVVVSTQG